MKLFALKDTRTNKILPNTFFANKVEAKKARNKLNEENPGSHVVTPGPDHDDYKGR